jgi:O-acetyl-ADP-ribose deacetylase (regulator of RNase III)
MAAADPDTGGKENSPEMTSGHVEITVMQGSILEAEAEAIVNAANSLGIMGGGVAGVIKRAAGQEVEDEARRLAPIPVGRAVATTGGRTTFRHIIHAPTMPQPAMQIPPENVAQATRAALTVAEEKGLTSLAIPGMGTGVGGVAHGEAAAQMIAVIRAHQPKTLRSVLLVDVDHAMVAAWKDELGRHGT